ncbi:uncharacterized protein LOC111024587, partial [Momordica charantia]|uniref:Uncharacterized protein LOC111024587 n=1 Tax=Momordica charantia TaxID=3673 RepID=A0A6J1DUV5_MOMCH
RGVEVDSEKVKAISEWPTPMNVGEDKLCNAPLLALSNFDLTFEIECDASGIGIGAVLMQNHKPLMFFSEKLSGASLRYPTYDKELYALYKQGKENIVADALSRRYALFNTLNAKILGFEHLKSLYLDDVFFAPFVESCEKGLVVDDYMLFEGFLFRKGKLCIPSCSIRELLVKEAHGGGLMAHFGVSKTYDMLAEHFYWPKMKHDVHKVCKHCIACSDKRA